MNVAQTARTDLPGITFEYFPYDNKWRTVGVSGCVQRVRSPRS